MTTIMIENFTTGRVDDDEVQVGDEVTFTIYPDGNGVPEEVTGIVV